jgi:tRNA pseudouridine38/39 synthase
MPLGIRPVRVSLSRMSPSTYEKWTREELIARLVQLDRSRNPPRRHPSPTSKTFKIADHPRRKIAVKFCYSGWAYNGLAFQSGPTPLPTVEEVLFDAFARTRLVDPEGGLEGCGWEKCGRTDRGVSAAGQVVSLWVRSALVGEDKQKEKRECESGTNDGSATSAVQSVHVTDCPMPALDDSAPGPSLSTQRVTSELRYVGMLNRVLPPTIRVLAWSPVSPHFSARFSCRHRHYKYFFTRSGLDVPRMQDAAERLVGEHDFRNLCKLDAAKQMTHFRRRILRAEIRPAGETEDVYVLDLVGSAFLYHQVRHIMAVLFLVGSRLEHPSVVSSLINVDPEQTASLMRDGDGPLEVVHQKPEYQMADALPLMLWDCVYDDADVLWRAHGDLDDDSGNVLPTPEQSGTGSELYRQLNAIRSRTLIQVGLETHFLAAAALYHPAPSDVVRNPGVTVEEGQGVMSVPLGGGTFRRTAKYVPLLLRKRIDSYEVANERWKNGKGRRSAARKGGGVVASAACDEGDE